MEDKPKMTFSGWREPKEPVRVVIPEGMLQVGREAYNAYVTADRGATLILEDALRWLSKNPMVPTPAQFDAMVDGAHLSSFDVCVEWQRRMFLAPEPEIPEAIRDLFIRMPEAEYTREQLAVEAFRRGQNSAFKMER
jgi:hypothetical protein